MKDSELRVSVRETSRVTQEDGETVEMSSLCEGCLRRFPCETLLTYTANAEGGRIFNRIRAKGKEVTVKRSGAVSLSLTLKEGQTEQTLYQVPPFSFDMTVTTESVEVEHHTSGGLSLRLCFRSVIGGAPQTTELVIDAEPRRDAK